MKIQFLLLGSSFVIQDSCYFVCVHAYTYLLWHTTIVLSTGCFPIPCYNGDGYLLPDCTCSITYDCNPGLNNSEVQCPHNCPTNTIHTCDIRHFSPMNELQCYEFITDQTTNCSFTIKCSCNCDDQVNGNRTCRSFIKECYCYIITHQMSTSIYSHATKSFSHSELTSSLLTPHSNSPVTTSSGTSTSVVVSVIAGVIPVCLLLLLMTVVGSILACTLYRRRAKQITERPQMDTQGQLKWVCV